MKPRWIYIWIGLFLLPLALAGVYILGVRFQALFRYDKAYFTPDYQKLYSSPGSVAGAIEGALHGDDRSIFVELTGLRHPIRPPAKNPNERMMIVLEVTRAGYFQELFFDVKTFQRSIYHIKKVDGRWVMVPPDAYYYLDSGDWLLFYTPLLLVWWSLLVVVAMGISVFRLASAFRQQLYGVGKK